MNYFKPSRIAFYLLSILAFFFLGVMYAALTGAAKNQGLAAGAIVVGYGFMGAFVGLVITVLLVRCLSNKVIVWMNIALLVIILGFVLYFFLKFKDREKNRTDRSEIKHKETEYLLITANKIPLSVKKDQPFMDHSVGLRLLEQLGEENSSN